MKNLKTLIIRNGKFSKGPKYLPNNLRVLEWWRYPSHCLPSDFHPKKLSICKLPYSCISSFDLDGLWKVSLKSTFSTSCYLINSLLRLFILFLLFLFFFFADVCKSKNIKFWQVQMFNTDSWRIWSPKLGGIFIWMLP